MVPLRCTELSHRPSTRHNAILKESVATCFRLPCQYFHRQLSLLISYRDLDIKDPITSPSVSPSTSNEYVSASAVSSYNAACSIFNFRCPYGPCPYPYREVTAQQLRQHVASAHTDAWYCESCQERQPDVHTAHFHVTNYHVSAVIAGLYGALYVATPNWFNLKRNRARPSPDSAREPLPLPFTGLRMAYHGCPSGCWLSTFRKVG